jgi:hypothetical protein
MGYIIIQNIDIDESRVGLFEGEYKDGNESARRKEKISVLVSCQLECNSRS